MFWNKKSRGSVVIYTVIIGLLCITAVYYIYTTTISERMNINEYSNYIMNCKLKEEDKQFLLDKLSNDIYDSVENLNKEKMKNYLENLNNEYKLFYKNSYLMYDKDKHALVIRSFFGNGEIMEADFEYDVDLKTNKGEIKYLSLRR